MSNSKRFSEKDSELIASLYALSKKNPKLVKSSTYPAPSDPSIEVHSWKMNEFKYYDIPSPFPTLARGLFTVDLPKEDPNTDGDKRYRIVARGYDKFFNIGEVPWTTWEALEEHTAPPYTLSLKSNGCIIFIAPLTSTKLIVTSKHSLGSVSNTSLSHAQAGEQWLHKYLDQKGKTEADLAKTLWENNWTAVAELCDDSFEEHVLGYPPEKTGLHLHGLNVSTKTFTTLPQARVDAFAEEWGFIKTDSTELKSIAEVRSYTAAVAEAGEWRGEPVEGFVVRTHVTEKPPTESQSSRGKVDKGQSPYAPGTSFFFKVKFDEPYMMYRDWRELTKKLIGGASVDKLPRNKMKRPETKVYVAWVVQELAKNPREFESYNKGKGIIATREKFLKFLKGKEGQEQLKAPKGDAMARTTTDAKEGKTIIVPIAIPGCGKTTVATALSHIFGFGHTQSDDVPGKKPAPIFIKNVKTLLDKHDVVIADKNNHLRQHREALREITLPSSVPIQLIALNWSIDTKPNATIHRICGDRVYTRGDNHQTLRADAQSKTHEDIIWMFIKNTEPLADGEVDDVVEMELEEDFEMAVRRAIDGLRTVLSLPEPSQEQIKEGVEKAKAYIASKGPAKKEPKKKAQPRYFGLLPEVDLEDAVGPQLTTISEEAKQFWSSSVQGKERPHITIVHSKSLPQESELWERCMGLHLMSSPPLFAFKLGDLVWNERVMAVTVESLSVREEASGDGGQRGAEFVSTLPIQVRERLHITIGTKNGAVAVEAKDMVEAWRNDPSSAGINSLKLLGVEVTGRLKGLMS